MPWSDDEIALLKVLWDEDRLSAAQMSDKFGKTRNAILGKANRLGLSSKKPTRQIRGQALTPKPRRKFISSRVPVAPTKPAMILTPPGMDTLIPFMKTTARTCRFIIDDYNKLCCSNEKELNKSWCEYHQRIVYSQQDGRR